MKVNANYIKELKGVLKKVIVDGYKIVHRFDEEYAYARSLFLPFYTLSESFAEIEMGGILADRKVVDRAILALNEKTEHTYLPGDDPVRIMAELRVNRDHQKKRVNDIESIAKSLDDSGFSTVVDGLPYLCISNKFPSPPLAKLCLMGIRKNGLLKKMSADSCENALLSYEQRMSEYIGEDEFIETENIETLLQLYREYLRFYCKERPCYNKENISMEYLEEVACKSILCEIVWTRVENYIDAKTLDLFGTMPIKLPDHIGVSDSYMAKAIVRYIEARWKDFDKHSDSIESDTNVLLNLFQKCLFDLEDDVIVKFVEFMGKTGEGMNIPRITLLEQLTNACYDLKRKAEEEKKEVIVAPKKAVRVENSASSSFDFLNEYIRAGRVVKLCDLTTFEDMLEKAEISEFKKNEAMTQMKNALNRQVKKELEEKVEAWKKANLSEEDRNLLDTAKTCEDTSASVKFIDEAIEIIVNSTNEEDILSWKEEIFSAVGTLRSALAIPDSFIEETNVHEDGPQVVYFMEKIGEVTAPRLLTSILKAKSINRKQVYNSLNKLLVGNRQGDRELKGDNFPVKVWYKVGDFKIFYTRIGEVTIIIDGDSDFSAPIVRSEEFKNFLSEVRENIQSGVPLRTPTVTASILEYLEGRKKMSMKPKKKGNN